MYHYVGRHSDYLTRFIKLYFFMKNFLDIWHSGINSYLTYKVYKGIIFLLVFICVCLISFICYSSLYIMVNFQSWPVNFLYFMVLLTVWSIYSPNITMHFFTRISMVVMSCLKWHVIIMVFVPDLNSQIIWNSISFILFHV